MKYEFHVGDYVETKANSFGYINSIDNDGPSWYCVYDADGYRAGEEYYVAGIENNELARYYNRIGQYDFTKPEQPKEIEKLPDGYGDGYVLYKGVTEVDGTVENGWVSIGVLSNKINELVDAVNELRKERT